ncbi:hypothetical protein L6164_017906 [Bauhinia variegata]|uniref:Uncharacterized protein n=1 Tax=Bauhinia variegata TaxID=167791 RepID=A0ACB9N9L0_BAUVA|nr:hypothetical protein L6164_017906 [Bauhinia variegata]
MSLLPCFLLFLHILWLASLAFGADTVSNTLSKDEVLALRDMAKTLGKNDWDFAVDPCSESYSWVTPETAPGNENSVTCGNCFPINVTNQICHVISIVLKGQNLQGTLPRDLFRLPYLQELDLEFNQLFGSLPKELGNLVQLESLFLTSNNFTGEIPATFAKLTALRDFRIGDNQFSGTIPNFIQNWTNLTRLRISDLNGPDSTFPQLMNVTMLKTLYLTGNFLSGSVPNWTPVSGAMNLFASSSPVNDSGTVSCLRRHANCQTTYNSFHINCGGQQVSTANGDTYDADTDSGGPARFQVGGENWAYSNTGHFMDNDRANYYTWSIQCWLATDIGELYSNARASPNSLTYYGFCLANGNYKVKLHFAEIMFDDDGTYNSLGRRIFDVYIQRKLVLKDFNIVEEAGGLGKVIIKNFIAVVNNSNLEIHLRWSGKGTTRIPFRSVYGPLISAISVESELKQLDLQTGFFSLRQIKAATNNFDITNKIGEGGFGPVYKAHLLKEKGNLMELVDERILGSDFNGEEAMVMIKVALLCTNATATLRPTMSSVVSMFEGSIAVPDLDADSSEVLDGKNLEAIRLYHQLMKENKESEIQEQLASTDGAWSASSSPAANLYPLHLDSANWDKRNKTIAATCSFP